MNNIQIKRLENQIISSSQKSIQNKNNKSFEEILKRTQDFSRDIKFSKHALDRMDNRNIQLSSNEMNRLKTGFDKAEEKGVNDALILMEDKAFIASIKNKTIITTVSREQLKDSVFTNIDGAVIV
jgi:flagellar operon protein